MPLVGICRTLHGVFQYMKLEIRVLDVILEKNANLELSVLRSHMISRINKKYIQIHILSLNSEKLIKNENKFKQALNFSYVRLL